MAKKNGSISYRCSNCGYTQPRWLGRCPECGEWNSLEEIIIDKNNVTPAGRGNEAVEKQKPVGLATIKAQANTRLSTGIGENLPYFYRRQQVLQEQELLFCI